MKPRVYVIYGQGGRLFSWGMVALAERLRKLGYTVVDAFAWNDPGAIIRDIRHVRDGLDDPPPIALIGFSLGANCTTWVADSGITIELLVAYDPSNGILFMRAAPPKPIRKNVLQAICYQQVGPEIVGRAAITGRVTTFHTTSPHLFVQSNEDLHQITLRALSKLKEDDK